MSVCRLLYHGISILICPNALCAMSFLKECLRLCVCLLLQALNLFLSNQWYCDDKLREKFFFRVFLPSSWFSSASSVLRSLNSVLYLIFFFFFLVSFLWFWVSLSSFLLLSPLLEPSLLFFLLSVRSLLGAVAVTPPKKKRMKWQRRQWCDFQQTWILHAGSSSSSSKGAVKRS